MILVPPARRVDLAVATVGVVAGAAGGVAIGHSLALGVVFVVGTVALVMVLTRPLALAFLALLGVYAVNRVGGPGGAVSYSDLVLVAATAIALPSLVAGPELSRLRRALAGLVVYLVCLLPAVVLDDASRGWMEWSHRLFLVGGAMLVGAWITREGKIQPALRALVAVSCVIALLAVLDSARNGFAPAYPLGLNKNFVGSLLKVVIIVVALAPRRVGLGPRVRLVALAVIGGGLLAAQSRGALIAAAAGMLFAVAFTPRAHGRQARGVVILLTAVLAGVAFFSVRAQFAENDVDFVNGSIGVRQQVEERAREIWRTSPLTGVGLKYFNSGEWGRLAQPANVVVDNELAESGVLGLLGFAVLQLSVIGAAVRRRADDPFLVVAAGCGVAALAHGMVDIYWTAGSVTLPFMILGMALAGGALDRQEQLSVARRVDRPPSADPALTRP